MLINLPIANSFISRNKTNANENCEPASTLVPEFGYRSFKIKNLTPLSISAENLDSDSRTVDLLVTGASTSNKNAVIFSGNNSDYFNLPNLLNANGSITQSEIIDITGNGKNEIVLLDSSQKELIIYKKSNMSYSKWKNFKLESNNSVFSTGNLSKNKRVDLIVSSKESKELTIIESLKKGEFEVSTIDLDFFPNSVAIADLNLDKNSDIVVSTKDSINILYGDENGDFEVGVKLKLTDVPNKILLSDINNDSLIDIVYSTKTNYIGSILNKKLGFSKPSHNILSDISEDFIIRDINSDCIPDLISIYKGINLLSILIGTTDGIFIPSKDFELEGEVLDNRSHHLQVADLNNDTKNDILLVDSGSSQISVLLQDSQSKNKVLQFSSSCSPTCVNSMASCCTGAMFQCPNSSDILLCLTTNDGTEPLCFDDNMGIIRGGACILDNGGCLPTCVNGSAKCCNGYTFQCPDDSTHVRLCATTGNDNSPICLGDDRVIRNGSCVANVSASCLNNCKMITAELPTNYNCCYNTKDDGTGNRWCGQVTPGMLLNPSSNIFFQESFSTNQCNSACGNEPICGGDLGCSTWCCGENLNCNTFCNNTLAENINEGFFFEILFASYGKEGEIKSSDVFLDGVKLAQFGDPEDAPSPPSLCAERGNFCASNADCCNNSCVNGYCQCFLEYQVGDSFCVNDSTVGHINTECFRDDSKCRDNEICIEDPSARIATCVLDTCDCGTDRPIGSSWCLNDKTVATCEATCNVVTHDCVGDESCMTSTRSTDITEASCDIAHCVDCDPICEACINGLCNMVFSPCPCCGCVSARVPNSKLGKSFGIKVRDLLRDAYLDISNNNTEKFRAISEKEFEARKLNKGISSNLKNRVLIRGGAYKKFGIEYVTSEKLSKKIKEIKVEDNKTVFVKPSKQLLKKLRKGKVKNNKKKTSKSEKNYSELIKVGGPTLGDDWIELVVGDCCLKDGDCDAGELCCGLGTAAGGMCVETDCCSDAHCAAPNSFCCDNPSAPPGPEMICNECCLNSDCKGVDEICTGGMCKKNSCTVDTDCPDMTGGPTNPFYICCDNGRGGMDCYRSFPLSNQCCEDADCMGTDGPFKCCTEPSGTGMGTDSKSCFSMSNCCNNLDCGGMTPVCCPSPLGSMRNCQECCNDLDCGGATPFCCQNMCLADPCCDVNGDCAGRPNGMCLVCSNDPAPGDGMADGICTVDGWKNGNMCCDTNGSCQDPGKLNSVPGIGPCNNECARCNKTTMSCKPKIGGTCVCNGDCNTGKLDWKPSSMNNGGPICIGMATNLPAPALQPSPHNQCDCRCRYPDAFCDANGNGTWDGIGPGQDKWCCLFSRKINGPWRDGTLGKCKQCCHHGHCFPLGLGLCRFGKCSGATFRIFESNLGGILGGLISTDFSNDESLSLEKAIAPPYGIAKDFTEISYSFKDRRKINKTLKKNTTFNPSMSIDIGSTAASFVDDDVNNDGIADLTILKNIVNLPNPTMSELVVYIGRGDGTFNSPISSSISLTDGTPENPAPEDGFTPTPPNIPGEEPLPFKITSGDFNADGNIDIAIGTLDQNIPRALVLILHGDGNGNFTNQDKLHIGVNEQDANPLLVKAADFNNDGRSDLAVVYHNTENNTTGTNNLNTVAVFASTSNNTFTRVNEKTIVKDDAIETIDNQLEIADLNNDGKLDIVVNILNYDFNPVFSSLAIFKGLGNGSLDFPARVNLSLGLSSFTIGDFNNDQKQDILASTFATGNTANPRTFILSGVGDGSFDELPDLNISAGIVFSKDINNDNKLDLVLGNANDAMLELYLGEGDYQFEEATEITTSATNLVNELRFNDIDKNGTVDILHSEVSSPKLHILINDTTNSCEINGNSCTRNTDCCSNKCNLTLGRCVEGNPTSCYGKCLGVPSELPADYKCCGALINGNNCLDWCCSPSLNCDDFCLTAINNPNIDFCGEVSPGMTLTNSSSVLFRSTFSQGQCTSACDAQPFCGTIDL